MRGGILIVLLLVVGVGAAEERAPTVGMVGRVEGVELPGVELEPAPIVDDSIALVVRIVETYPRANGFVYDFEFYGLEPGDYNLVDYLRPADGSELVEGDLPAVNVAVGSVLPPGQVEPRALGAEEIGTGIGYQAWLTAGGVVWVLVLGWLVFGWRKKVEPDGDEDEESDATLAERLRPLVERARDGGLSTGEQAKLERLLLAYWREKLGLIGMAPEEAMRELRQNDEAGELLRQMEAWLHQPGGSKSEADIGKLLEPYRQSNGVEALAG